MDITATRTPDRITVQYRAERGLVQGVRITRYFPSGSEAFFAVRRPFINGGYATDEQWAAHTADILRDEAPVEVLPAVG